MPYPYQINAPSVLEGFPNSFGHRPFRTSNGNLYLVLREGSGASVRLEVYRSVNDGVNWSAQDTANRPSASYIAYFNTNYFFDGTRIWCVYFPGGSYPPTESHVKAFNTSTNLWETAITGGPVGLINPGPYGNYPPLDSEPVPGVIVRANGEIVVFFSDVLLQGGNRYTAVKCRIYNPSTMLWGGVIDLLVPGLTEFFVPFSYSFQAALIGYSNVIHVIAWTILGYATIQLLPNNGTAYYRRYDMVPQLLNAGTRSSLAYGLPQIVTLNSTSFIAIPVGHLTSVASVSNRILPGLLLIRDMADPDNAQFHYFSELVQRSTNWISICVTQDTDGAIYLLWTLINPSTYETQIRISCTRGKGWNAPSTIFTSGNGELIETMEISASGGVLRAWFENSNGEDPYDSPHYWQTAVSCPGAPVAGEAKNVSGLSYA